MKFLPLLLSPALLLTACGGGSGSAEWLSTEYADLDPTIQAVFSATPPAGDPEPIPEVLVTAEPGQQVLLEGRIMGVMNPFVGNRAVFVLGDNTTITPCSDVAGDECHTPWDACCDPKEIRQAGTATIQIVDADGRVVHQGLEGVKGLQKLATVRVAGTLAPTSRPDALVVNATAVQAVP